MAAQRSDEAFKLLVQQHQARVYRIAYSMLGNEADAREISQDAFIRLFKSAHKSGQDARLSTWFYRVLVKLCIDQTRREKGATKPLSDPHDDPDQSGADPSPGEQGPERNAVEDRFHGRLGDALLRLSAYQRLAVLLQVQDGLSSPEIGEVLNCSENSARAHIYRGMAALKKLLGNE